MIALQPGLSALFYNWDNEPPKANQFFTFGPTPCTAGKIIVDIDFKWLYQLLDVAGGDWDEWRCNHDLPTPSARCPGDSGGRNATTGPGSDCVHAYWDLS